jgi:hypothetical protein
VIGPQRVFSHGQLYHPLVFFLLGIAAPPIQWVMHKKFKMDCLKYLNFPLLFGCTTALSPGTMINYISWILTCFIFNYVIRRRRFYWWCKYNCELDFTIPEDAHFHGRLAGIDVLSAGLDAGYAIGSIIIFFALIYPKNGTIGQNTIQTWWVTSFIPRRPIIKVCHMRRFQMAERLAHRAGEIKRPGYNPFVCYLTA